MFDYARRENLKTAVLTRNSRSSAQIVFDKHQIEFDAVICREDAPPKPSPEPVFKIARMLDVQPERSLMVGDYKFDVMSGNRAGATTVFLTNGREVEDDGGPHYVVHTLHELKPVLENLRKAGNA